MLRRWRFQDMRAILVKEMRGYQEETLLDLRSLLKEGFVKPMAHRLYGKRTPCSPLPLEVCCHLHSQ